jgi:heme/copper-type cytochrome/quinol oxidase subunit 2
MTRRTACTALWLGVTFSLLGISAVPAGGQAPPEVKLTIQKDTFEPAELRVKAAGRFILVIINNDDITHELDIPKLRLEKKVRPGQTVRLQLPALKPGRYDLADDDSTPNLHGVMIAE